MSKPAENRAAAPVLITMGEPSGIGPEIAAKAWHALGGVIDSRPLKFVGDPDVFREHGAFPDTAFWPSHARSSGARAVIDAIEVAVRAALAKEAAAIVTAPIHKAKLLDAGFAFLGHTEYLKELTGSARAVMMLAGGGLRVVPLTIHVPLAQVPALVTCRAIIDTAEIVLLSLKRDFRIERPRLAIVGLNPHAGESGQLGREDIDTVGPAADELRARGHDVRGPLSADTMFHAEARARYDAALCMYHDQALIPLKTLAFWEGVNVTLGLPIVRTSPDHGTASDIAGRGIADPRSMIAAVRMAAAMANARGL
jgi:4-hydroxythreonine-4-phosphate dehydrogenase